MPTQTCGDRFRTLIAEYTDGSPEQVTLVAAGFIAGQAETVAKGVYPAAMFRPAPEYTEMVIELASRIAQHYDLVSRHIWGFGEVWIFRASVRPLIDAMVATPPDTPAWHAIRAHLGGSQLPMREGPLAPMIG